MKKRLFPLRSRRADAVVRCAISGRLKLYGCVD
jgi:hypothetical protein